MNFKETLEYIEQSKKYGSVLGLNNIKELLERLGNPQRHLNVVHVAGTNGKGSVIAFLMSVLVQSGYKVGAYISPAVDEYCEIIQIDGKNIDKEDVAGYMTIIRNEADKMSHSHPTLYEMETAMAFMHFAKVNCDIVLLETGMGGSEDATNVMDKVLCSVLTSISMDHMQYLGDTVKDIAECKAGIIKAGCPVVVGIQEAEFKKDVFAVVKAIAAKKNSRVVYADFEDMQSEAEIDLSVQGVFQRYNAAAAIAVVSVLRDKGYIISDADLILGLKKMRWHGRFEKICDMPAIIIDGAHNAGAAKTLAASIEMYFTNEPIVFIMGILADKEYNKIIEETVHLADMVFTITPDNPRALDGEVLAEAVRPYNANVEFVPDIPRAVDKAAEALERICGGIYNGNGAIIVFGSLSFLGKIRKIVSLLNS